MTLEDLIAAAKRGEAESLHTLREVAEMTHTPYPTIRGWRVDGSLPVVLFGPHDRLRVTRTTILRMFCRHREVPAQASPPVRYAGNGYLPCARPSA
jgi:hypothetical protein